MARKKQQSQPASQPQPAQKPKKGMSIKADTVAGERQPSAATPQQQQPSASQDPQTREKTGRKLADNIRKRSGSEILESIAGWLYDHALVFCAVYAVVFLVLGIFFNRYISFGAGLVLVALGWWVSARDGMRRDTFIFYIAGLVIFAIPFMIA